MLIEFITEKIKKAKFEVLEDKTFYGYIPGYNGVWASGKTLKSCKEELKSVFEDWILFTLKDGGDVRGLKIGLRIPLNLDERELVRHA